jgi:hypothetical protein
METPSELAVVDTFTKLIFGVEAELDSLDMTIVQALRLVDDTIALDGHSEMGVYLRALGVKEMIKLVAQVRQCFPLAGQTLIPVSQNLHALSQS